MATMMASTSGAVARAAQRVGSARRPAPFSAAKQLSVRSTQLRAKGEVDPYDAEMAVIDAATTAAIEMELASAESKAYLTSLAAEAADIALSEAAMGAAADEEVLQAMVAEVGGEAQEVEVTETFAPIAGEEPDLLETLDNESATAALEVVRSLKLPKEELAALVPADWDATTVDWFTDTKKGEELPLPSYRLTFLWGDNNLLAAVDQTYARGANSPLTEYFFWPRKDAWEDMRLALEARPWISERDKVLLLNRLTEVINYWQVLDQPEGAPVVRPTMEEARALFPDCTFAAGQTGPSREAPAPMTYEQPAFDQQPAFDAEQQPAFDATA